MVLPASCPLSVVVTIGNCRPQCGGYYWELQTSVWWLLLGTADLSVVVTIGNCRHKVTVLDIPLGWCVVTND